LSEEILDIFLSKSVGCHESDGARASGAGAGSVANLTRNDGIEFFETLPKVGIATETTRYSLAEANTALDDLRSGRLKGAAVLVP